VLKPRSLPSTRVSNSGWRNVPNSSLNCLEHLAAANSALEELSLHDALTGLANRRFFDQYLATQIAVARRHKRPLALVLCDIDNFKAYNDH